MSFIIRLFVILTLAALLFFLAVLQVNNPSILNIVVPYFGTYSAPLLTLILIPLTFATVFVALFVLDFLIFSVSLFRLYRRRNLLRGINFLHQAEELFANGYTQLALLTCKKAVAYAPKVVRGHVLLGNLYRKIGKLNEAIDAHERGILLSTDKAPAMLAQVQDFEAGNEPKAAARLLDRILNKDKKFPLKMADRFLERFLAVPRRNVAAMAEMRRLFVQDGNYAEALKVQEEILDVLKSKKLNEPTQLAAHRGLRVYAAREDAKAKKFARALRNLKTVIKEDGTFVDAHLAQAEVLLAQGKPKKALDGLKASFKQCKAGGIIEKFFEIGEHLDAGDFDPIRQAFHEEFIDNILYRFIEGRYFMRMKKYAVALDLYRRFEPFHLPIPEIYENLARCEEHSERPDRLRIIKLLDKALQYQKKFDSYHHCRECDYRQDHWSAECPECGSWNSFEDALPKIIDQTIGKAAEKHADKAKKAS